MSELAETPETPETSETPQSPTVSLALPMTLALMGLAVSGILEWIHVKTYLMPSVDSFCTVNDQFDCGTVALSRFSVLLGVPLPIWGAAGFLAMAIAAGKRLRLLWPLSAFATLASVLLLLEELFHVGAICFMCEAVHVLALLLAIVAFRSHRKHGAPLSRGTAFSVLGTPAAMVLATMILAPKYWVPLSWQNGVPVPHGVTEDGHPWVGAEEPTVIAEEFVDYGCPHCAIATNRTRQRLAEDGNRLRIVRRHQPRKRCHERNHGCIAQRAAHCAAKQGKFWEMDAWLFAHVPGQYDADVLEGARTLQLDEPSFMLCLEDPATYEWADGESKTARKLQINATPMYRVDGILMLPEEYQAVLDREL